MLDAVQVDHKLKHDGRVHMYGFLKAAGLTLDETMKWMVQNFTAYVNAEKEHGYNVRHAYGREGNNFISKNITRIRYCLRGFPQVSRYIYSNLQSTDFNNFFFCTLLSIIEKDC